MSVNRFIKLFGLKRGAVIGMVHVRALPGTPQSSLSINELVSKAKEEAKIYVEAGLDGILVENMFDLPYVKGDLLGPEVTACMTRVCHEVRQVTPPRIPCGVQILAGGNTQALSVCLAAGLQFIRAEGYVFGHVGDEGVMQACAGPLLRYRRSIGATHVLVMADVKKKHCSHAITSDLSVVECGRAAQFFNADGVVVTGGATGEETDVDELKEMLNGVDLPVLVGSGVTEVNVSRYIEAHGLIVGSHFKEEGRWSGEVDAGRVRDFMKVVKDLRKG